MARDEGLAPGVAMALAVVAFLLAIGPAPIATVTDSFLPGIVASGLGPLVALAIALTVMWKVGEHRRDARVSDDNMLLAAAILSGLSAVIATAVLLFVFLGARF